jgi:hypothetical protein
MKAADVERAAVLLDRRRRLKKMLKMINDKVGAAKPDILIHGDCQNEGDGIEFPGDEAADHLAVMLKATENELAALGVTP